MSCTIQIKQKERKMGGNAVMIINFHNQPCPHISHICSFSPGVILPVTDLGQCYSQSMHQQNKVPGKPTGMPITIQAPEFYFSLTESEFLEMTPRICFTCHSWPIFMYYNSKVNFSDLIILFNHVCMLNTFWCSAEICWSRREL